MSGSGEGCEKCAATDARGGRYRPANRPCDICAGTGLDFLGRDCRHCRPKPLGAFIPDYRRFLADPDIVQAWRDAPDQRAQQ